MTTDEELMVPVFDLKMTTEEELRGIVFNSEGTTDEELTIDSEVTTEARGGD